MSDLTLYQVPPSPNCIRIRLALGFKRLEYTKVDVGFEDRSQVLEVSRQPLTPVLSDGGRVIYDSYAIMRYLDANFREGPSLFSADRAKQQGIQDWELFARIKLGECMGMVIGQLFAGTEDEAVFKKVNALLAERCQRVEDALAGGVYLTHTETPNAADLTVAPFALYGCLREGEVGGSPVRAIFAKHIQLPASFARTRAWVRRCMAYDR